MADLLLPKAGDDCLSVRQPWATGLVTPSKANPTVPVKPVENRTKRWPSTRQLPVDVWIHASLTVDYSDAAGQAVAWLGEERYGRQPYAVEVLALHHRLKKTVGVIVGRVTFTGCHHAEGECHACQGIGTCDRSAHCSPRWAEPDVWHWQAANPMPLATPIPAKGRLGLWKWTEAARRG